MHPNSRFATGNKLTLETIPKQQGIDLREELLKYHAEYYSANIMTLVVLGKNSISDLKSLVTDLFKEVPSSNRSNPSLQWWGKIRPYEPSDALAVVEIVPVMDSRKLVLSWPLWVASPELRDVLEHSKPEMIVTHLLGHEGKGSIRSYLIEKGWANALQASIGNDFSDCQQIDVSIDLTKEGFLHRYDVAKAVFGYIAMLKVQGIPRYIYDEVQQLSKIAFEFREKSDPSTYVSSLAADMQLFSNPAEYLTGSRVLTRIDEPCVKSYLKYALKFEHTYSLLMRSQLTPEECRLRIIASDFKGKVKTKERWYQTEYNAFNMPKETEDWKHLNPNDYPFHIPSPNQLIPQRFELVGKRPMGNVDRLIELNAPPKIVEGIDSSRWTLWHKLDRSFRQPKIYAVISLSVPSFLYNPEFLLKAKLFNSCFMDSVSEFMYDANLAGLSFELEFTSRGVQLIFSGFSDKFQIFVEKCIDLLKNFRPAKSTFLRYKDVLLREINSWKTQQPYQHVSYYASLATETLQFPIEQLERALIAIDVSDIDQFISLSIASSYGQALIMGNIDVVGAKNLLNVLDRALKFEAIGKSSMSMRRVKEVPIASSNNTFIGYLIHKLEPNANDDNSAVTFYYQLPTRDMIETCKLEMLAEIIEERFVLYPPSIF